VNPVRLYCRRVCLSPSPPVVYLFIFGHVTSRHSNAACLHVAVGEELRSLGAQLLF